MYSRFPKDENDFGFFVGLIQIALAVFIGGLAAMFAYEGITALRLELAARRAMAELQRETAKLNAQEAQRQRQLEEARLRVEQEAARQRGVLSMAQRLDRERKARKDSAWNLYHKPSPACQIDSSTVACANEYMAARKRFEAAYVDR